MGSSDLDLEASPALIRHVDVSPGLEVDERGHLPLEVRPLFIVEHGEELLLDPELHGQKFLANLFLPLRSEIVPLALGGQPPVAIPITGRPVKSTIGSSLGFVRSR